MAAVKISSTVVYYYRLALSKPLFLPHQILRRREGLILQLTSSRGLKGFGEIAPLPGLSRESLNSAIKQLRVIQKQPTAKKIPFLYPSVQFGLETALLHLSTRAQNSMVCALLSDFYRYSVAISALLEGSLEEVCALAREKLKRGYRSFKLKVGRGSQSRDVQKVKALEKIFGATATLRLDANQAWDFDTAIGFATKVNTHIIDYIEEPLKDKRRLSEFYLKTRIPFALDESLTGLGPEGLQAQEGLKAVILKPTLLGGLSRTMKFIRQAESLGIEPVISSSFETGIGLAALANLAACTRKNLPAGLDTRPWFKKDLLKSSFQGPLWDIHKIARSHSDIDFNLLRICLNE